MGAWDIEGGGVCKEGRIGIGAKRTQKEKRRKRSTSNNCSCRRKINK